MAPHFRLMVPGAQPHHEHAEVLAPYDGTLIATVERADRAGVESALETAHRLFRDRDSWLRPHDRRAILERTARMMNARREDLAGHPVNR